MKWVMELLILFAIAVFFISLLIFCVVYVFNDLETSRQEAATRNGGENPIASLNRTAAETSTRRRRNRGSCSETSSEGSDERSNTRRPSCTRPVIMHPPPPPSYAQLMHEDRIRRQSESNQNSNFRNNLHYWDPQRPFLSNTRRNHGPPPAYSATIRTYTSNGQSSSNSGVTQTSLDSSESLDNPRPLSRLSKPRSEDSDELPPPYYSLNQPSTSSGLADVELSKSKKRDANDDSDEYYSTISRTVSFGKSSSSSDRVSPYQMGPTNGRQRTHENDDDAESDEDPVVLQRNEMFIHNWMEWKFDLRNSRVVCRNQDQGSQTLKPLDEQPGTSTQSLSEAPEDETSVQQDLSGTQE